VDKKDLSLAAVAVASTQRDARVTGVVDADDDARWWRCATARAVVGMCGRAEGWDGPIERRASGIIIINARWSWGGIIAVRDGRGVRAGRARGGECAVGRGRCATGAMGDGAGCARARGRWARGRASARADVRRRR